MTLGHAGCGDSRRISLREVINRFHPGHLTLLINQVDQDKIRYGTFNPCLDGSVSVRATRASQFTVAPADFSTGVQRATSLTTRS